MPEYDYPQKYPLGRKKPLLNPFNPFPPKIFSALLPKESRFPGFSPLLPKEYGTLTIAAGTGEPFSPKIYPALLPKESRFSGISPLLPKE